VRKAIIEGRVMSVFFHQPQCLFGVIPPPARVPRQDRPENRQRARKTAGGKKKEGQSEAKKRKDVRREGEESKKESRESDERESRVKKRR
jgi:hypothetical protein